MNKVLLAVGLLSASMALGQNTTTKTSSTTVNTSNYNTTDTQNYNSQNATMGTNSSTNRPTSTTGNSYRTNGSTTGTGSNMGTSSGSNSMNSNGSMGTTGSSGMSTGSYGNSSTSGSYNSNSTGTTDTMGNSNNMGTTGSSTNGSYNSNSMGTGSSTSPSTNGTYNSNSNMNSGSSTTPNGSYNTNGNYNSRSSNTSPTMPSSAGTGSSGTSGSSDMSTTSTSTYSTSTQTTTTPYKTKDYQNFAFGVFAGLNSTRFRGESIDAENPSGRLGYQLGLFVRGGGRVYGQIGAEYFASSSNYFRPGDGQSAAAIRDQINIQYIQIPVYIGVKLTESDRGISAIRLQAGAEYANRISSSSGQFNLSNSEIKSGSFNALGQLGFDIGPFLIDLTYHHGLSNAIQITNFQGSTRRILSASVGFKF